MKSSISLVTGGFDPLHKGHLEYINEAKTYSDYLVVGINSDQWLINKKDYEKIVDPKKMIYPA